MLTAIGIARGTCLGASVLHVSVYTVADDTAKGSPCVAFLGCFMQHFLARRTWEESIYLIIITTWDN